jgi:hypothetical protein
MMAVLSEIGAYTAQAIVTKVASRTVGAAGMTLVAVAFLLLDGVSADGNYLDDLSSDCWRSEPGWAPRQRFRCTGSPFR